MIRNEQMLGALNTLARALKGLAEHLKAKGEAGAAHDAGECLEDVNRIIADLQKEERPIKTPPFCVDFGGMRFNGGMTEVHYLERLFTALHGMRTASAADKETALAQILEGISEFPPQSGTTFRKRSKFSGSGSKGLVGRL